MALTRTEDKTDKAIARLLLQNPMGLTIGDITAEAKCTPQTARKSLARIGAEKDASGMLYVLRDDDTQQPEQTAPKPSEVLTENWGGIPFLNPFADAHAPEPTDPAPVAEAPAAQPERTHAETTIRQFKPGDYVVPLRADRAGCDDDMKKRIGKVLQVFETTGSVGEMAILAGQRQQLGECWFWHPDDLRRASIKEVADAHKPKPLRRGDLVVSSGDIYVVIETNYADGGCWIYAMTGKRGQDYIPTKELTRIGSIRKQVKRLRQQMEGGK